MVPASKKSKRKGGGRSSHSRGSVGGVLRSFVWGGDVDETTSDRLQEIKGLLLIGLSLWLLVSVGSYFTPWDSPGAEGHNWGGQAGYYLATWVFMGVGWSGYLLGLLGLAWGGVLVTRKHVDWPTLRLFGAVCFLLSSAFLLQLGFGSSHMPTNELPYGPGGWLALELVGGGPVQAGVDPVLVEKFGLQGLWILLTFITIVSFMLATEMAFYPSFLALRDWMADRREAREEGVVSAVWSWTCSLAGGLWDFLRGADIGEAQPASASGAGAVATATRSRKNKKNKKSKTDKTAELFDEDEDEEPEQEWEYVDEDGNPIDPEELAEYEDDEEEDEDDEDDEDPEYDEYEEEIEEEYEDEYEEEPVEIVPAAKKKPARKKPARKAPATAPLLFDPPTPPPGPWRYPPIELLEPPSARSQEDDEAVRKAALKLEGALRSFRVNAEVINSKPGASVTLFELEVEEGTRMNKVTQLSQEIAAALRAKSVRIIAPIPGKSTIGIEVPNKDRQIVRLSELISQKAYDKEHMALPLFLGKDAEGAVISEDLARMPHLLIAGTTGSGKSVCINTILASLLLTRSPHDVQMILVDPKMVELQMFSTVPHLMLPVVTDMRQATNVLLWAVEKMEGRYDLFKNAGVRNIKSYNKLSEDQLRERMDQEWNEERTPRHVPYILVVIDEMADLMMTSKKEAEQAITRLAQKSRAVGIHVIVATQRPSTDVITGVIKGNLPTRIAFQVASKVDSRVILDVQGAEKLLGSGDMLYNPPQSSQITRVQGALVEDHELQALVDFVCKESAPNFSQELIQATTGSAGPGSSGAGSGPDDDLWDEAVRVVLKSKRGSASLLQRALGIGYTRASRLIDLMTSEAIVGEYKGSKAREVLMSLEDWEEMHGAPAGTGE